MIGVDRVLDVHDLKRQGHSIRAIAELTGLARNTVRKVLRGEHSPTRKPTQRATKLDPFKDYLRNRRAEHPLSAVRLLAEIRPMGYTGSLPTLRRFLARLGGEQRRQKRVTVRFETPPGHQAQADWAFAGKLTDATGTPRPVYVFTFVLSFSRVLFIRCTHSMNLAALIDGHRHAFAELGGWPKEILYDNMKQVRLGPGRWNEGFLDFARHYGFTPKTHRPYRPRTKGKVERAVEYVRDSFLLGRTFTDLDDLNAQARAWLAGTANVRLHATTGQRPVDLLAREALTPLATVPAYEFLDPVRRTVSFESMVHFRGSRYSVPPAFAGRPVEVNALGGQIVVRAGDTVIAEHREAARSGQCVVARDHIEELWKLTAEQIKPPTDAARIPAAEPQVRRVDLRTFEEVSR
jgi:transposase